MIYGLFMGVVVAVLSIGLLLSFVAGFTKSPLWWVCVVICYALLGLLVKKARKDSM